MDGEESMEHSPEHVADQNTEDGVLDLDEALFPDKSPSSGPQSDYGYDEVAPKSQESMITDAQGCEINKNEESGAESDSDSEESPESPPLHAGSPMEQEYPVVNEEEAMNIRSPDVKTYNDDGPQSPDDGPQSPDEAGQLKSPVNISGSPHSPQEEDEEPCSTEPLLSPDKKEDDTGCSPSFSRKEMSDSEELENRKRLLPDEMPENADSTNVQEEGLLDAANPELDSKEKNIREEKSDSEHSEHLAEVVTSRDVMSDRALETVSDYHVPDDVCTAEDDGKASGEEHDDSDLDIYSLDLMVGNEKKEEMCISSEKDGGSKDSDLAVDSRTVEKDQPDTQGKQGETNCQISDHGDSDTFSNIDTTSNIQSKPITSSPKAASPDALANSSEVSNSSNNPEVHVHSTSIPLSEHSIKHHSEDVHGQRDELSKGGETSGDNFEHGDIPNGHDPMSPESGDVRAGRVQQNTSFNEEHVELDYDEEEEDKEHAGPEDKNKEGSDDEKCDGELSGSDDDKDDGELDDDEDCEEGEIREPGSRKPLTKPVCRFFLKGNCTWGQNCRFIHPGVNDRGNYRLFDPPNYNGGMGVHSRLGTPWGSEPPPEQELPPPPPPPPEQPVAESAWERGLRHAKEMRKKANMRKEQETNFEEKRMNLSLDEERELNKENERSKFVKDPYYDQYDDDEYYGKAAVHAWHPGSYENFEIRWTREDDYAPFRHEKEREHFKERRYSPGLDRIERLERQMYDQPPRTRDERRDKYREERMPPPTAPQGPRGRADEWHDPWQRSKSPKQKKRSSRSRSRGRRRRRSYSVSSRSSSSYSSSRSRSSSFSSRSSRSSYSRSSSLSSRSPSPRSAPTKKSAPHPPEKKLPSQSKSITGKKGANTDERKGPQEARQNTGKKGANSDERKGPQEARQNTGKKGANSDERKGPQEARQNEQPRSAVTVRSKQRSPDKRPTGMSGPPGKLGRQLHPGGDRGRRPDRLQRPPRSRPGPGHRSSSGSSVSRSRSRSSSSSSRSRSGSSRSSRSRSSSTSSSGSADSEHLYRDLPGANRQPSPKKKPPMRERRIDRGPPKHSRPVPRRRDDHRMHDRRDDRMSRQDSRSGMRTKSGMPTTPVKAKDPLKLVGQKSNIKLTLLNKHAEKTGLVPGAPPLKRRMSDGVGAPPPKRMAGGPMPLKQTSVEKPKPPLRPEKVKSPPPREKPSLPVKPSSRPAPVGKPPGPIKVTSGIPQNIPPPPSSIAKPKKSTTSRREELLKQLKAVEDAIARKKSKMQ